MDRLSTVACAPSDFVSVVGVKSMTTVALYSIPRILLFLYRAFS